MDDDDSISGSSVWWRRWPTIKAQREQRARSHGLDSRMSNDVFFVITGKTTKSNFREIAISRMALVRELIDMAFANNLPVLGSADKSLEWITTETNSNGEKLPLMDCSKSINFKSFAQTF